MKIFTRTTRFSLVETRYVIQQLFLLMLFCSSASSFAQDMHIVHCLAGCPTGAPESNDMVIREIYALSHNETTKFADWVAYRVTRETIGTSSSLDRDYKNDEMLSRDITLETDDYSGAYRALSTDRGHLAPLASFAGTHFWRVTNIISNIAPQKSTLNQGPWADLEGAVRIAAFNEFVVYVITGLIHDPDEDTLILPGAEEDHQVPTGFFKVVAKTNGRVTAFMFDQDTPRNADYCDGIVSFDDVETKTGLTFFPENSVWPTGNMDTDLGCGSQN